MKEKKRDEPHVPEFLEKVEHYNAKLIPFALVLLLGIIIFELFLHIENQTILTIVHIADYIVIVIFVIDLSFIAYKVRNIRIFFSHYWLDLLAIFPFALFLRALDRVYLLVRAEEVVIGQSIVHETVEAGKAASKVERLGKFSKFSRGIRIIARVMRFGTKVAARFHRKKIHRAHNTNKKTRKTK